jgi:PAS domain S-box-containing protein
MNPKRRLFTRVLIALVVLFGGAALISAVLAASSLVGVLEQQYRSKGRIIAETIAQTSEEQLLLDRDAAAIQALVDQYCEIEGIGYILIQDSRGVVVGHSFAPAVPEELLAAAATGVDIHEIRIGDALFMNIDCPILEGELGVVHVGMDRSAIDRAFRRALWSQSLTLGAIGLAALIGAWYLVARLTRSLGELARQARRVAGLESLFDSPLPVVKDIQPITKRDDEVGQLAVAVSHMIESLAAREQQLHAAEEARQQNEEYFRSLTENVTDVILLLNPEGVVRYVSPSLLKLLGYLPEDWHYRDISLLVHADDRETFRNAVSDCLPSEPDSLEVRMIRDDGEIRIVDMSLINLLLDRAVGGIVVTIRDITESKRTIELAQAREAAEEASRFKSELLARMSHELFTPMNQILGLTKLTMEEPLNADQRDNLIMVCGAGEDLIDLFRNLLDFSNLKAGRATLDKQVVNLVELLSEVQKLLRPKATTRGLRLTLVIGEDVPQWFVTDPDRLRRVLLLLGGNAIKFTQQGEVNLIVRVEHRNLFFEVRDTGIGIAPEKQSEIFEPFVQADGSQSRSHDGAGVGLSLAQATAQLLGGRIQVTSQVGVGSVFWFALPLEPLTTDEGD